MFMPATSCLEKATIGPERSCIVPITISFFDTPCVWASDAPENASARTASFHFIGVSSSGYPSVRTVSLRQSGTRRTGLRLDPILETVLECLGRMTGRKLAHEGRVDGVAEHFLQPHGHLARDLERHALQEVLLLPRPGLAVLVREREARRRATVRAATVHQRARGHNARPGRHWHGHR